MNRLKELSTLVFLALSCAVANAGPVDINSADAETISNELNGVGISRANAIVEYRKQNGPFKSADELLHVKGIGERTLELNAANIRLSPVTKKVSN